MTLVGTGWPKSDQNSGQKGRGKSFFCAPNMIYFLGVAASAFKTPLPTEMGLCFPYQHDIHHGLSQTQLRSLVLQERKAER